MTSEAARTFESVSGRAFKREVKSGVSVGDYVVLATGHVSFRSHRTV